MPSAIDRRKRNEICAKNLRTLLSENGLKQEDLATEIGASQSAMSRWTRAIAAPQAPFVASICDRFNVSADWFTGRTISRTGLTPGHLIVDLGPPGPGPKPGAGAIRIPDDHVVVRTREEAEKKLDEAAQRRKRG